MRTTIVGAALMMAACLPAPSAGQDKKKPEKKARPMVLLATPLGVAPGTTARLNLRGMSLDQAKEVKIQDGLVKILSKSKSAPPDKLPPEKFGDSQVEVELKLASQAALGSLVISVVTPEGESPPHRLLVESAKTLVQEKEPNEGFRQAQPITVPCIVEGRIERQRDVDVFRIAGKAGQKLVVELQAARHGSALDAMMTLYNADGNQIASASGGADNPDARLNATLPADGVYYLALLDAHDLGGALHVYRLAFK